MRAFLEEMEGKAREREAFQEGETSVIEAPTRLYPERAVIVSSKSLRPLFRNMTEHWRTNCAFTDQ